MTTALEILNMFGINAKNMPFLILALLIIGGFIYLKRTVGNPINTSLAIVKDNLLVVCTHLSSPSRGKLDVRLLKQMSPFQIQPEGQRILQEVGFPKILEANKERFFSVIRERKPQTKLDVENYAIYSFLEVMAIDSILNRIKIYLYEHPDIRDTFPTLAGVYIRDKYLEEHTDITQ